MLKVALCFSGHARTYHTCIPRMLSLIHASWGTDIVLDIFVSMWEERGYLESHKSCEPDYQESVTTEEISSFIRLHLKANQHLKKVMVIPTQTMIDIQDRLKFIPEAKKRLIPQYFQIEQCHSLLDETYDWVIRSRMDIYVDRLPPITELRTRPNEVWVNHEYWRGASSENSPAINEMFWIMPMTLAIRVTLIHQQLRELYFRLSEPLFYGESVSFHHFKFNQIPFILFSFSIHVMRCSQHTDIVIN